MPGIVKPFLFFICDTPTGAAYYLDSSGNIQTASILSGNEIDLSLKNAPDGWLTTELGFSRNTHYYGINRSYSMPMKLVNDAAQIVRTLYYTSLGRGIETPLSLLVYKINDDPQPGDPQYKLYYKGQIDLPKNLDRAGEGLQVNLMEGGVMQLLKAYENSTFTFPCDGSIQQNIKVNCDGLALQDTLYYEFVNFSDLQGGVSVLGLVYIDDDGDNIGVQHGDPIYTDLTTVPNPATYLQTSGNFLFSDLLPTSVRLKGNIAVRANANTAAQFSLFTRTSLSTVTGTGPSTRVTNSVNLISKGNDGQLVTVPVQAQTVLTFDETINLAANEQLYICGLSQVHGLTIIGGSLEVSFISQYQPTAPWGIKAKDLWTLIGQAVNKASSTTDQVFNYRFDSKLLEENQNLVFTSGDALRASGDPDYHKYFNAVQTNPNFPNLNQTFTYGPVIKISLAQFFDAIGAIWPCALSNEILTTPQIYFEGKANFMVATQYTVLIFGIGDMQVSTGMTFEWQGNSYQITGFYYDPGTGNYTLHTDGLFPHLGLQLLQSFEILQQPDGTESLYLEERGYVFDSSSDTFDLGEVSDLTHQLNTEYFFNGIRIGYAPQQYDQKAGKYEYNTTAEWIAPIKTIAKIVEIICSVRTDAYGIERLRSGVGATSTTNNSSDNSVFILNANPNLWNYDKFSASFLSQITDTTLPNNTNQRLIGDYFYQNISFSTYFGNYLSYDNTPAIFIFNQTFFGGTRTINVVFNGTLAGNPGDTLTISLMVNGVAINQWIFTMPGNATFSISYSTTHVFNQSDTIYLTTQGSPTASAQIGAISLQSVGDFLAQSLGVINIQQGSSLSLIQLPTVVPTIDVHGNPYVSYGFQYLFFNSILANSNFDMSFSMQGLMQDAGNSCTLDFYINGAHYASQTYNYAGSGQQAFTLSIPKFNRSFVLGDIVFAVASATNNNNTYITQAELDMVSTQIKAYSLKRVNYSNLSGVPRLVQDTSQAGAPYNLEDLTPKRMMNNWGWWFRSILYNQIPGFLNFYTLSKNQYLSTTYNGVTVQENLDIPIGSFAAPKFYPIIANFKTRVPDNFADLETGTANTHCSWKYNGVQFYGFPMDMRQKPGLNEMQTWKMLLSTKTDLADLIDLNIDGLNYILMGANSIFCPPVQPVQFVPEGLVLPAQYHTRNRDQYWFSEQISNWLNQNNYWNPWESGDTISLQFQTNGLSPVVVNMWSCAGVLISTTSATLISNPAIVSPIQLWQVNIPLTGLVGQYYLEAVAGTGGVTATLLSEGLNIAASWPLTMLIQYSSSKNKQATIFVGSGYTPSIRVQGYRDNHMKPKYKGAFYVDQPQDIQVLNAINYEVDQLWITGDEGVPDYVIKKIARIMLLDQVQIDDTMYSIDEGAEWNETNTPGNPKKFWSIDIRQTSNADGITANAAGVDSDPTIFVTLDANPFGPNYGNAGSQDTNIISIITS